jgi:hypothetical protein
MAVVKKLVSIWRVVRENSIHVPQTLRTQWGQSNNNNAPSAFYDFASIMLKNETNCRNEIDTVEKKNNFMKPEKVSGENDNSCVAICFVCSL